MLAKSRTFFLCAIFIAFPFEACMRLAAQAAGSAPPISSFGLSAAAASAEGVRPGLATIGPNGLSNSLQPFLGNCCASAFLPGWESQNKIRPPLAPRHRRRPKEESDSVAVPVYIPYAIGYVPYEEEDEDAADDSDAEQIAGATGGPARGKKQVRYGSDSQGFDGDDRAAPEQPEEPVVAQPTTVLVFKDGHRTDVVNYAIVGDALFDFDGGRTTRIRLADLDLKATEKANDALGVDFTLPPVNAGGGPPQ